MPLVLLAALAAGWFAFWTGEAPSPTPVAVHADVPCAFGGVGRTSLFGAAAERLFDGSYGARALSPLFVSYRATGPSSVWVEGGGAYARVRVDGRVAAAVSIRPGRCTRLDLRLTGKHRIGLELGVGDSVTRIAGAISPEPAPAAPRAVFLGDSYSLGVGGRSPAGYAYRAGWAKGWDVRVDAEPGTGFLNHAGRSTYAERLPEVLRQKPSTVVVEGGINDFGNFPNAAIARAAGRVIQRLRDAGIHVVVLSPWETPRFRTARYRDLIARIGAVARAARVRYIDTSSWITPRLMSDDGIHPNERGYRTIAAKLAPHL